MSSYRGPRTALKEKAIRMYVRDGVSGTKIAQLLSIPSRTVYKWISIFAQENEESNRSAMKKENQQEDTPCPAPTTPQPLQPAMPDDIEALKSELSRVRKELTYQTMRADAYDEMINIAERQFDVSIRKKSWRQTVDSLCAKFPGRYTVKGLCTLFGVSK